MRCTLFVAVLLFGVPAADAAARERASEPGSEEMPWTLRSTSAPHAIVSSGAGHLARAASQDTLYVYGAPGSGEGTFEAPLTGYPDWQGWTSVDRTFRANHWQRSTFNAETLGGHGPGNVAYWCGVSAEQKPGWKTPPGYGNRWDDSVVFETPMADPSIAQQVELSFFFHHDSEPGYDFFQVEYDSAGTWIRTLREDGDDADLAGEFSAPGESYEELAVRPIHFAGNDYGEEGDVLRIRLRFTSDGAWSDEDGLHPSWAGAVQVDDVRVRWDDGTGTIQESFEDFESADPVWRRIWTPFAGDFADLHAAPRESDPCADREGVVGFIDTGQALCPEPYHPDCLMGTGGSTGEDGFPWVVNYEGGLSNGLLGIHNEVWSPEIAWDLPTPDDDGLEWSGLRLSFDVYTDLPLRNGIFYIWSLRSSPDGVAWSRWQDTGYVYFNDQSTEWIRVEEDVSDLIARGRLTFDPFHSVQIALGVIDLADYFGFPGDDATVSPLFDNVSLAKYRMRGPLIRALERELAADAFPASGTLDTTDLGSLDVRFDMAHSVGPIPGVYDLGDSVVIRTRAVIPGTEVTEARMQWALERNPLFDDGLRQPPSGPQHQNVDTSHPLLWTGEVVGAQVGYTAWTFDLPDQDFLYPGDVLRYRFLVFDDQGRTSALPVEEAGLLDGISWDPRFAMHALPSLRGDGEGGVVQPDIFVAAQSGEWRDDHLWRISLDALGLVQGEDFDIFTVLDPGSTGGASFGAEGGSGATPDQLGGYDLLFLDFGARSSNLLGDGFETPADLPLLESWHALEGPRAAIHFGTDLAWWLDQGWSSPGDVSEAARRYLQSVLGIELGVADIRERRAASVFEEVVPGGVGSFAREYPLMPSCDVDSDFDGLFPAAGLAESFGVHGFARNGGVDPDGFASVIHDRGTGMDRKVDMTFSFSPRRVATTQFKAGGPYTSASWLLAEIFDYLDVTVTPTPPAERLVDLALTAYPTPFNPSTKVRLSLSEAGEASLKIFDLRGRHVRTLFEDRLEQAGIHDFRWDGRDDRGQRLASGVYVLRARVGDETLTRKVSLLK